MSNTNKTPKEEFQDLLDQMNEKIKVIDKTVPWNDAGEPNWWLTMMEFQRHIRNVKESLK